MRAPGIVLAVAALVALNVGPGPAAADHNAQTIQAIARSTGQSTTPGVDVSLWQGTIDWVAMHNAGIQWAYITDTEGASLKDANFTTSYPAAFAAGLIRGALHTARPSASTGAAQADYFVANGGGWSADNQTLPGALILEPNPYPGGYCYGLNKNAMVSWINSFVNQYHTRTGRWAVIQTTLSFWRLCTNNNSTFAAHDPLWIVKWDNPSPGTLPAGWSTQTMWQNSNCTPVAGLSGCADGDLFNGAPDRVLALANNTP